MPDESLDYFMSTMVATDLTIQAPSPCSEGSSLISEPPTPTLHHDTSSFHCKLSLAVSYPVLTLFAQFLAPMLDGGHSTMSPNNYQVMDSHFANDLRRYISNAFHSD